MDWVTTADRAHQHLGVLLREDVQLAHADLYATILREDPELSSRVAELRATDEQLLLIEFDKIALSLSQLRDRAQSSAQDEQKAEILRLELVRQALAFVISARTQETRAFAVAAPARYRRQYSPGRYRRGPRQLLSG